MELRQLQYFIAAADTLNFSRAAESLYISQPTLSQQIAELERELGVQLFVRTKRSVTLTLAGIKLLQQAKDLLHQAESMTEDVRNSESGTIESGKLCIGFEIGAINTVEILALICDACAKMREEHPGIRIFFRECTVETVDRDLREGEVDAAIIIHDSDRQTSWENVNLMETELVLRTFSRDPIPDTKENTIRLLNERPVFMRSEGPAGMAHILELFGLLGVKPKLQFLDSPEAIRMIVASGDGIHFELESEMQFDPSKRVQKLHFGLEEAKVSIKLEWNIKNNNPTMALLLKELAVRKGIEFDGTL